MALKRALLAAAFGTAALSGVALRAATLPATAPPAPPTTLHVLFIGNSLTYYHDMPATFRRMVMATHPGLTVDAQVVAPDGVMLEDHWRSPWTQARLHERHWDYIVLQEQGGLSRWLAQGKAHRSPPDYFDRNVDHFAAVAKAAHSQLVFYETAPVKADAMDYTAWVYTQAAIRHDGILAPVGRTFYALPEESRQKLIGKDGHPTEAGSCLIAATLAASVFTGSDTTALLRQCSAETDAPVAQKAAPVIDQQLAAIGTKGAYHPLARPVMDPPPAVAAKDPATAVALEGSWYAREAGLPITFGIRLDLSNAHGRVVAHLTKYGVNTAFDMPIDHLDNGGNRLTIDTHGDNRHYQLILARSGETLTGYTVVTVNGGSEYVPVTLARSATPDAYFAQLDTWQKTFDTTWHQRGLDAALLERYSTLQAAYGKEAIDKATMGGAMSDPWLALLAAQDYADRGDDTTALAYDTFATTHFPDSADAHGNRGEQLVHMGRLSDALPELTLGATLLRKDKPPQFVSEFDWFRDDVAAKLAGRADPPAVTSP